MNMLCTIVLILLAVHTLYYMHMYMYIALEKLTALYEDSWWIKTAQNVYIITDACVRVCICSNTQIMSHVTYVPT